MAYYSVAEEIMPGRGDYLVEPTAIAGAGRLELLLFGAGTPKQIDQGIDLLSEIIDHTIDDPSTDVTRFLCAPS
jgi:hypothetical protein